MQSGVSLVNRRQQDNHLLESRSVLLANWPSAHPLHPHYHSKPNKMNTLGRMHASPSQKLACFMLTRQSGSVMLVVIAPGLGNDSDHIEMIRCSNRQPLYAMSSVDRLTIRMFLKECTRTKLGESTVSNHAHFPHSRFARSFTRHNAITSFTSWQVQQRCCWRQPIRSRGNCFVSENSVSLLTSQAVRQLPLGRKLSCRAK